MITRYKYEKRLRTAVFILVLELYTITCKKVMLKMALPLKEGNIFLSKVNPLKPTYILLLCYFLIKLWVKSLL